ncbi:MAG: DUF805 domain-containing protein [Sphingobacteriaceae bacterium]|nr:DUF805 domain-containing protein [Sphingobacteriaceae bacterium]
MNWYLKVLKNYAVFSGRARRTEYWMFVLFQIIFAGAAAVLDNLLGLTFSIGETSLPYGYLYLAYGLAMLIPGIAVFVRRLHDVGKSGWFFFIGLIPLIGAIWLLVLACTDSQPGENEYGPNPKEEALVAEEVQQAEV